MVRKHYDGARYHPKKPTAESDASGVETTVKAPLGYMTAAAGPERADGNKRHITYCSSGGRWQGRASPEINNNLWLVEGGRKGGREAAMFIEPLALLLYPIISTTTRTDLYSPCTVIRLRNTWQNIQRAHRASVVVNTKPKRDTWNRNNSHPPTATSRTLHTSNRSSISAP